jgi:hypothetical protein
LAIIADALLLTFIRFTAFICFFVPLLARWTIAAEWANRVDASSSFAECRNGFALVNI